MINLVQEKITFARKALTPTKDLKNTNTHTHAHIKTESATKNLGKQKKRGAKMNNRNGPNKNNINQMPPSSNNNNRNAASSGGRSGNGNNPSGRRGVNNTGGGVVPQPLLYANLFSSLPYSISSSNGDNEGDDDNDNVLTYNNIILHRHNPDGSSGFRQGRGGRNHSTTTRRRQLTPQEKRRHILETLDEVELILQQAADRIDDFPTSLPTRRHDA